MSQVNARNNRSTGSVPTPELICPAWCDDHTRELVDRSERRHPGEVWEQHRRVLSTHHYPLSAKDGERGVRELTVEQDGFDSDYG